jgi:preprotein translocase subunit SecF
MVTSILIFGGDTLFYFALGAHHRHLFGIYSSVLVASPIVMWLGVSREDLVKPEKPKQEAVV